MAHRILIVDDDLQLLEMMGTLFSADGFETDLAANGEEALDKARLRHPSLIVLDMLMPVMDGWTFRAHLRYDEILAVIPVVIVTGVPVARLKNVNAAATLQKPVSYERLVAAVREHL